MRLWNRIKLGFRILFGLKFGVMVDNQYASGVEISNATIKYADAAVIIYDHERSVEDKVADRLSGDGGGFPIFVHDNHFSECKKGFVVEDYNSNGSLHRTR